MKPWAQIFANVRNVAGRCLTSGARTATSVGTAASADSTNHPENKVIDWESKFEEAKQRVNPGWPNSIAVSEETYLELRNKLNPKNIVYDEESGREFLLPPP